MLTEIGKGNGQAGSGGGYIEFSFEHVDFEMVMSHPSGEAQRQLKHRSVVQESCVGKAVTLEFAVGDKQSPRS